MAGARACRRPRQTNQTSEITDLRPIFTLMNLALFYAPELEPQQTSFTLDEPTSKHCIQVLRMTNGHQLMLTNGRGLQAWCSITDNNRKRATVSIDQTQIHPAPAQSIHVAMAFTKNASRNEWFLEKATEIGIQFITPVLCKRSEKDKINADRWTNILVSAMLQSQQFYLPVLSEAVKFEKFITQPLPDQRLVAHCLPEEKTLLQQAAQKSKDTVILIGPEGDFTEEEVKLALAQQFKPVSLGHTRLRTETAGMVAVTLLNALHA